MKSLVRWLASIVAKQCPIEAAQHQTQDIVMKLDAHAGDLEVLIDSAEERIIELSAQIKQERERIAEYEARIDLATRLSNHLDKTEAALTAEVTE